MIGELEAPSLRHLLDRIDQMAQRIRAQQGLALRRHREAVGAPVAFDLHAPQQVAGDEGVDRLRGTGGGGLVVAREITHGPRALFRVGEE